MPASIDLRSDTVTRPDDEMRRAMASAEVGDDVYGEDPTVRRLEEEGAALLGCEASLFVPSGVMGNQIALHLHGSAGGEVLGEATCHLFEYEMGAMAVLSGLVPRRVHGERGLLAPEDVEAAIQPDAIGRSRTVLLSIENTHNVAGGVIYARPRIDALLAVARRAALPCHLDGARLLNAAVALGLPPAELSRGFDSVLLALSKGLGCPVGSLLAGDRAFISAARRVRKLLGGGMRQSGVLAAAALVAFARGFEHLAEDHRHARMLADGLAGLPGVVIRPAEVETNIVAFQVAGTAALEVTRRLAENGVLASAMNARTARFVTHRDVSRADVEEAIRRLRRGLDGVR